MAQRAWPPALGEPLEHYRGDFHINLRVLGARADGLFAVAARSTTLLLKVGVPQPLLTLKGAHISLCQKDDSAYVVQYNEDGYSVSHFPSATDANASRILQTRVGVRNTSVAPLALDDGSLLIATGPGGHNHVGEAEYQMARLLPVPDAKHEVTASFVMPFAGTKLQLLHRPGGSWLAVAGKAQGIHVYRVSSSGRLEGEPWIMPARGPMDAAPSISAWGDGFVIATSGKGGITLQLVEDSVGEDLKGQVGPRGPTMRNVSMLSGEGEAAILVAYDSGTSIEVSRIGPETNRTERTTEPPSPVEPTLDHAPRVPVFRASLGQRSTPGFNLSRDHFVSQIRLRHILVAMGQVNGVTDFPRYQEYAEKKTPGTFCHFTDSGVAHRMAWNAEGLVALPYDSDCGPADPDEDPARYLPDIPPELAALVPIIRELQPPLATGGLWIAGDRSNERAPFPWNFGPDLDAYALSAEEAVFGKKRHQPWKDLAGISENQARLGMHLERASRHGGHLMTPDEKAVILFRDANELTVTTQETAHAASLLAQCGIAWDI